MKLLHLAAPLALAVAVSAPAMGEDSRKKGIYIAPSVNYYHYENGQDLDDDIAYSLGVGYRYASPWAVELSVLMGDTQDNNRDNVDEEQVRLDLHYYAWEGQFSPYGIIGLGNSSRDFNGGSVDQTFATLGGGITGAINSRLNWRSELRFQHGLDNQNVEGVFALGLTYVFGGDAEPTGSKAWQTVQTTQASTFEAPKDTDRDGVYDKYDECPDTDYGAKVNPKGCYILIKQDINFELSVNFPTDSAEVAGRYHAEVEKLATFMQEYPLTKVVVEGHTDSVGSDSYNMDLSKRRAAAVAAVLVERFGIAADRVSSEGFGETRPVASNDTAVNRAANRRVVGVVSAIKTERAQ